MKMNRGGGYAMRRLQRGSPGPCPWAKSSSWGLVLEIPDC